MYSRVVCVLLLAAFSAGHKVVPINDQVDKEMEMHNKLLTPKFGMTPIEGLSFGGVELSSGVEIGMNSLYRTGDCFAQETGASTTAYTYRIGYRLLVFAFGNIRIQDKSMSGFFRVNKNSMRIEYTVQLEGPCKVTLNRYEFTEFDDIEFGSSDPDFDGKEIKTYVNGDLKMLANDILSKGKDDFEEHLQSGLCKHHQPN